MPGEWWHDDCGDNMLAGVEGDPLNPPRLSADYISDFLCRIVEARESFNRLVPNMLPLEQERLTVIIQGLPQFVALDPKVIEDTFQHTLNTASVRTCGPYGGTRRGG